MNQGILGRILHVHQPPTAFHPSNLSCWTHNKTRVWWSHVNKLIATHRKNRSSVETIKENIGTTTKLLIGFLKLLEGISPIASHFLNGKYHEISLIPSHIPRRPTSQKDQRASQQKTSGYSWVCCWLAISFIKELSIDYVIFSWEFHHELVCGKCIGTQKQLGFNNKSIFQMCS